MNLRLKGTTAIGLAACMFAAPAFADMEAAKAFLDKEIGDLSALSREDQEAELQFFIDAAKPFEGMSINVVSETIGTHTYESTVLAPAFEAITGIKVTHDLIGEGDVVEKLQTQMQSGENIYDAYINDSDLIGTHWRYQQARNLSDWMEGEGKAVTNPGLDLEDFIGLSFTSTGPHMRTSPNSSPVATCRVLASKAKSLATWTTARKTRRLAGATPMRGCRWPVPVTWASQTVCPSTNGVSASTKTRSLWGLALRVAVPQTGQQRSML